MNYICQTVKSSHPNLRQTRSMREDRRRSIRQFHQLQSFLLVQLIGSNLFSRETFKTIHSPDYACLAEHLYQSSDFKVNGNSAGRVVTQTRSLKAIIEDRQLIVILLITQRKTSPETLQGMTALWVCFVQFIQ